MRVVLTKQPNFNVDDFDFLTEGKKSKRKNRGATNFKALDPAVSFDIARNVSRNAANFNVADPREANFNVASYKAVDPRSLRFNVANINYSTERKATSAPKREDEKAAEENVKNTLKQVGGIRGMFQWLMDQIAKIPGWMQTIGGYLKTLWEKIKGWMVKLHIVDRVTSFSKLTIACARFLAASVLLWIRRFKDPDRYINKPANDTSKTTTNTNETTVFIETFGEILREDSNGGMFIAMTRPAIEKGKKIANDICIAFRNSKNGYLKNLVNTLRNLVYGSSATLTPVADNTIPSRLRRRFYYETAFDDSLSALYESIIREAQAHKIKEIKKKAKKKVAIKQAKAKRSLRGRI